MNRRTFFNYTLLTGLLTGMLGHTARGDSSPAVDDSETGAAIAELLNTLNTINTSFTSPTWQLNSSLDLAEARRMLLHHVLHALQTWLEGDPARPFFVQWHGHHKKPLGDNPDAIYFSAVISDQHQYRIRGNIAGASYTSFTEELGVGLNAGLGATMNDTEFDTDENGNYEIILSKEKVPGNWMPLNDGVASITTRHYYERKDSINNDPFHHIPLSIENVDSSQPPVTMDDKRMAAGIRLATSFIEQTISPPRTDIDIPFVSWEPNTFKPFASNEANQSIGYAAKDNVYAMAPFVLAPNQALVIRGRFPKCRFANVMLFNRFLATLDYRTSTVSLNRQQVEQGEDGDFEIYLSAKNPQKPNWIDTQGRSSGLIYWRFLLPEEPVQSLQTEVIQLA